MIIHDFQDPQQTSGALCWPLGGGAFIQWWWLWICTRTLRHVAWELEKWTDTGGMFFWSVPLTPSVCRLLIATNFQGSLGYFGVFFHARFFLSVPCLYQSHSFVSCHVHCSTMEYEDYLVTSACRWVLEESPSIALKCIIADGAGLLPHEVGVGAAKVGGNLISEAPGSLGRPRMKCISISTEAFQSSKTLEQSLT